MKYEINVFGHIDSGNSHQAHTLLLIYEFYSGENSDITTEKCIDHNSQLFKCLITNPLRYFTKIMSTGLATNKTIFYQAIKLNLYLILKLT